jgi:Intracellular proteinase inhibitor
MRHSSRPFLQSHIRRAVLGVMCVSFAAACGTIDIVPPQSTQDQAAHAVDLFAHLADSVSRSGGDGEIGVAYASLAEAIRQAGRVSQIVVTVDGVPTAFLATAQQTDIQLTCPLDQFCLAIKQTATLRSLIAWQEGDPSRIIQLSSAADSNPIRAYLYPTFAPFPTPSASLVFMDGKHGSYFGTSGSQKFVMTPGAKACTVAAASKPTPGLVTPAPNCTEADFIVSFDGKAEPSSFLSKNPALGIHTFTMSPQPILGARYEFSGTDKPAPPIGVRPVAALPAALSAKLDSLVTLTLTVSNPSSSPIAVSFSSGQHYDFTISDAATGVLLWRWGMGMMFTQTFSSQSVPANGTLVYTTQWKPAQKGNFVATGSLVSASHGADAKTTVSVP